MTSTARQGPELAAEGFSEPPSQKIIAEAVDATEAAVSLVAMLTMNEQVAGGIGLAGRTRSRRRRAVRRQPRLPIPMMRRTG